MIKFLIENIDFDFAYELIKSIKFINWYNNDEPVYSYEITKSIDENNCIPIGSLEFVFKYLEKHEKNFNSKPINIPNELLNEKFTKRKIEFCNICDLELKTTKFVKSAETYKGFTEITNNKKDIPNGNYMISDVVDIESEYRCFVYKRELKGIQHYSGDFKVFPNVELILDMINKYKNSPIAYTLDVGINQKGTFIIEVHPMVSCGLYGFKGKDLPRMLTEGYKSLIIS